ncbi:glutamate synthase-related protein [Amycolatopsis sp. DG1A-15b]|uniref:glutamate synthase-related protein n=1 Tax=Amycolatopsis sp. DG1A-15b TaxID=3052846 RepID=UPI00255BFA78|nr:glutamate synthase-related protein [Amycolatopsis sp. DG1A-15b]WIX92959.1 glutamate synthase-related protein [Amycolatopsis sp. DG1A-15b]
MRQLHATGFPEAEVRERARTGSAAIFPPLEGYGQDVYGQSAAVELTGDPLALLRIVPPVFMPDRLAKMVELGREPAFHDVDLDTRIGGFRSPLPVYLSAFGSTQLGSASHAVEASRQAGSLGLPMVVGENVVPIHGSRSAARSVLADRVDAYLGAVPDGAGGVVVQQSTEDADAEVWNDIYSDPATEPLLRSERLGFELKVGQGAKPGLGGMTVVDARTAASLTSQYATHPLFGSVAAGLRTSIPGTFTEEILVNQVRMMRNNFPRARVWVKLPPASDIAHAATVAWEAGADAVTVDGAEAGTGWAPRAFLTSVGLPLGVCLDLLQGSSGCLLSSGRIWEGTRAVKCLALGARSVGLGRAALIAVDENPRHGLVQLVEALTLELRMLISSLGVYTPSALAPSHLWSPVTDRSGSPTRTS